MPKTKTEHLYIPVTPEEKAKICRGARLQGFQMATWAREILLHDAGRAITEHELSQNNLEKLKPS